MSAMINVGSLQGMADKLAVYDVDQSGWEHEGQGYEVNARHVLFHLCKDITGKDFRDSKTVRSAIAPDSLQYAIRLSRWTGQNINEIVPNDNTIHEVRLTVRKLGGVAVGTAAYIEASAILARNLHDLDYAKDQKIASANKNDAAAGAGRMLVFGAYFNALYFNFNPEEAFDSRLNELRSRFGIPQPTAST